MLLFYFQCLSSVKHIIFFQQPLTGTIKISIIYIFFQNPLFWQITIGIDTKPLLFILKILILVV
jgi:hypothetical protein